MQELKAEKPLESPAGTDPVTRLIARLRDEGFTTEQSEDEWRDFGEIIFRRDEKISIVRGETVVIFTAVPELSERILRQTSESVVNTYKAKSTSEKAMSVMQSTTVYHVLVAPGDQPHNELLARYITRVGGATFIPIIIVPDINQVVYPDAEEAVTSVRPRVEYLQYLLGERRESVDMHRQTIQAFYVSAVVIAMLVLAVILSFVVR
jgi:hypothetical protein